MPLPDSPDIAYCTAALHALLRAEPRLKPFRAPLQPQRTMSYADAMKIGSSLAGVFGASAAMVARFASSLTRQGDRRAEADFLIPAPACPRPIQVQEHQIKPVPGIDLKVQIYNRRCILTWGTYRTEGGNRLTPQQQTARVGQPWVDEPEADAAHIASVAALILNNQRFLLRIVTWHEVGMSGPVRPSVQDSLFDPASGTDAHGFLGHNAGLLTNASEAMFHSWTGDTDSLVFERRSPPPHAR
ncbi:MAG TPA: hypothetical protein VHN77_00800 [Phycisphaerales bacterium]|nr:hypothetical protein [Phycisphaerales bacterium]